MRHRLDIYLDTVGYFGKLYCKEPMLIEERDNLDYKGYSSNVDDHIASGYKEEVLVHWKNMNVFIESYNTVVQVLHDNIIRSVIQRIKEELPLFVEYCKIGEKPLKCYIPEALSQNINYTLQYYLDNNHIFDVESSSIELYLDEKISRRWKLSINTVFAESDEEDSLKKIKLIIKEVLADINNVEKLEKQKQIAVNARVELQNFKEELTKLIKLVENGIPLNGRCKICKEFS